MASNFTDIGQLRFWCQKILPLVYDDSLSYYELLCKVVEKLNLVIQNVDGLPEYIGELISEDKIKPILDALIDDLRSNIAKVNEKDSPTATADRRTGELLWWKDNLYEVVRDMNIGDAYIDYSSNPNIKHVTIEELISNLRVKIDTEITDRENADNILQGNIDAEATARENADNTLQGNIAAEATARENADILLSETIENEKEERIAGDEAVKVLIKGRIPVNVKEYGAVGDGVTNDTDAINRAINVVDDNGYLYFPYGVYVVNENFTTECILYFEIGTILITPNGNLSNVIRPNSNLYNACYGYNLKLIRDYVTPQSGGVSLYSREWNATNDDNSETETIIGNIANGVNKIISNSNLKNVKPGDGILCSIPGWLPGTTRMNTMRVVSVVNNEITFAPDLGDGGGTPISGYSWTGDSYNNITFTIRHRRWYCVDYLGAIGGRTANPDHITWCANDVVATYQQMAIGREIDLLVLGKNDQENKALFLTGAKRSNSNSIGLLSEMGGEYNNNIGIAVNNALIGMYSSGLTSFLFTPTFRNNETGHDDPIAGGLVQSDYGEYGQYRPSIAVKQIMTGGKTMMMKRKNDSSPSGTFIDCYNEAGTETLFSVDVIGGVKCKNIRLDQTPTLETIVCDHTITIYDDTNTPIKIPCKRG